MLEIEATTDRENEYLSQLHIKTSFSTERKEFDIA